jgi:hypothetical protein
MVVSQKGATNPDFCESVHGNRMIVHERIFVKLENISYCYFSLYDE